MAESNNKPRSLQLKCFQTVREHFSALDLQLLLDLPVSVLMDLLPHLTVCQLDELQPALNLRGISTISGWKSILYDNLGPSRVLELHSEEETKRAVMTRLFRLVFYGFRNCYIQRNLWNLDTPHFLLAAARCVRNFEVLPRSHESLRGLAEERRDLLDLLEENVTSVIVAQSADLEDVKTRAALFVLHRLLDHGQVTELVLTAPWPPGLAWILHGRGTGFSGSSYNLEPHPCICSELDSGGFLVDFCHPQCPRGCIRSLVVNMCDSDSLQVLNQALPTFCSLQSLSLQSLTILKETQVLALSQALQQLALNSSSCLSLLSLRVLPGAALLHILLDSSPRLTVLRVHVWSEMSRTSSPAVCSSTPSFSSSDLLLEELNLQVLEPRTETLLIASLLRRCHRLRHLLLERMRSSTSLGPLLHTLTDFNHHSLRFLLLHDLKLSDCFPEILHLLRSCQLEELRLTDCRLLESVEDQEEREERLRQLVSAVKAVQSLKVLGLAQNRLARSVSVLAELFSGPSASCVQHLDISSNFIQASDLLELSRRLKIHPPAHDVTLDLRKNPGDRDPDRWSHALGTLGPPLSPLSDRWKSTGFMLDHVSNM